MWNVVFEQAFIEVDCPRCRYPMSVQLLDVRLEAVVYCPNCKASIQMCDEDSSVDTGLKRIDDAMSDFLRGFRLGS